MTRHTTNQNTSIDDAIQLLLQEGYNNGLPQIAEMILNAAMLFERSSHLAANPYERSATRNGYANGFKGRTLKSALGALNLKIPQTREASEPFYPSLLERGSRIDQALKSAIAEMYLQGVSTRRVTNVMEELCGLEVTSTQVSRLTAKLDESFEQWRRRPLSEISHLILDATYIKVRVDSSVRDCAVLVAIGIHREGGKRMILGVSVALSEAEVHWRAFLSSLRERGIGIPDQLPPTPTKALNRRSKPLSTPLLGNVASFISSKTLKPTSPKSRCAKRSLTTSATSSTRATAPRPTCVSTRVSKNTLNPLLAWPNGWKMPSPRVSRYSLCLKLFANDCELQICAKHSTLKSNGEPKSPAFFQTKPLFCASSRLSSWISPRNGNPEKPTFPRSKPTN